MLTLKNDCTIHIQKRHVLINVCFWTLQSFAMFSFVYFAFRGNGSKIALCAATPLLLCLPRLAERLLRMRLSAMVRIFALLFTIGPLLGHAYDFYYVIPWWDNLLHMISGILFALLGYYLPDLIDRQNTRHSALLKYMSAICFALATAAVWEFLEYGMDQLFNMDMQQDSIVNNITSYYFGSQMGLTGAVGNIQSVIINGVDIGLNGYLDIGLHDTMTDMLVCALGAASFCLVQLFNKSKREYIEVLCQDTEFSISTLILTAKQMETNYENTKEIEG